MNDIINGFQLYCDSLNEDCPVVLLNVLELLNEFEGKEDLIRDQTIIIGEMMEREKEQKEQIDILRQTCQSMMEGQCVVSGSKQPQIVRCKECKHGNHIVSTVNGEITIYRIFCTKPYVERGNATHEPDWFCADGERK